MTRVLRVTLAYLAFSAAVPGLQATLSPSAFYEGFPFGRGWVQMLPPYNEHLIHDVGNYKLAFAILFAWAAWRPSRELVVPVASAWSVAALLHAGYHALNLDGFGAADAIALIVLLVSVLALPLLAIVLARREPWRAAMSPRVADRHNRWQSGLRTGGEADADLLDERLGGRLHHRS